MATTFYYRLPSDNDIDCLLWSGRVTASSKQHLDGLDAVRAKVGVKRLPKNTLVVSSYELESGQWDQQRIRAATLPTSKPAKRYAKSVHDVPTSFDEIQDMLKKLGLA